MKSYEDILERSTNYWKETDRKSYIALYKGERLNTKQIAYLTPAAAKKAVIDILKAYSMIDYGEREYKIVNADISAWVKQAVKDGIIEIVALEDIPHHNNNSVTDDFGFESFDSPKSNVEPMVLCKNYNEYFNAQINN